MNEATPVVVLYHSNCPDGFGSAYAAWKKFGDAAEYVSMNYSKPMPNSIVGSDVYFLDMCFPKEIMDSVVSVAHSVTVLDHHEGVQEITESMPNYVYDVTRSGATISWSYFHPDVPVPTLLRHIEDDDVFRFVLPETKPILAYMAVHQPFSFEFWDQVASDLDTPGVREALLAKATSYREYFDLMIEQSVARADLIQFEGHTIYIGQVHPMKPMVSALGHALAVKRGPFAIITQVQPLGISVSLRGDDSIDLTKVAQKYGGNGHFSSAAFLIPWGTPLPWTYLTKEEKAVLETYEAPRN